MKKCKLLMGVIGSGKGGMSQYMVGLFSRLDPARFDVTFLSTTDKPYFGPQIESLGGHIAVIPPRSKHPIGHKRAIRKILQNGNFDVCHIHLPTASNIDPVIEAHRAHVPQVFTHSHNSAVEGGRMAAILHKRNAKRIKKYTTERFACSGLAGDFMYAGDSYTVIPNAIDLNRFSFDAAARARIREELAVGDAPLIGQISRMMPVKNHAFTLKLMEKIRAIAPDAKLLFAGDGPLRESIEAQVKELGLSDCVIFTGNVDRPEDYYCAIDVMILPSFFEGFPLSVMEALAVGLPVFISQHITKEVILCDRVQPFSLETDLDTLARQILHAANTDRQPQTELLKERGFDAEIQIRQMENYYCRSKGE